MTPLPPEFVQIGADAGGPHQGLADQHGLDAGDLQAVHVPPGPDSTLGSDKGRIG
jgi:hypothetical protein